MNLDSGSYRIISTSVQAAQNRTTTQKVKHTGGQGRPFVCFTLRYSLLLFVFDFLEFGINDVRIHGFFRLLRFGAGAILGLSGAGKDLKVSVAFDDPEVGTKQLLVAFAGLEREWESA